ncbi:MAG: hypothetical protein LBQ35_02395, partial [Spirochaetaceae bacterium]|nr:hypothetical protein [Spirochaetaceae bacterium]
MKKLFLLAVFLGAAAGLIAAQDFGFGPAEGDYGVSAPAVTVGGEVSAELQVFTGDLGSGSKIGGIEPGNIFSGALNFSAAAANAAGVINLKLKPDFETPENMLSLDEAYVSAFFGAFSLEAGLRKLTWGKADSFGPLDVINPLDYSDLSAMSDPQGIKLARPLLHGSLALGAFTKLEGVFV